MTTLPKNLIYSLRFPSESRSALMFDLPLIFNWHTGFLYPLYSTGGPRNMDDNEGGMVFYNREGFIPLQNSIASAYIKMQSNENFPNIYLQVCTRLKIKSLEKSKSIEIAIFRL